MIYRMRFTPTGTAGAAMFVGSIALSSWGAALTLKIVMRGRSTDGLFSQPMLYALCAIVGALGFAMMLQGREIITPDELPPARKRLDL